ncbi:MAG: hypothetical protein FJ167_10970 [Gammaproteobacteria bacterium]|nr:hypothetical protein [Gammaproteobacteria bacterium]
MTSRRLELMQWLSDLVSEVNKAHPELQVEMPKEDEWGELVQYFFVSPTLRIQGIEIVVYWDKLDTARRFSWVDHALGVVRPPKWQLDWLITDHDAIDDSVQ